MSTDDIESTIVQIAQQHLVQDSQDPAHCNTTDIPYHLPGAAITHDIYNHANSIAQSYSGVQRSKSSQSLPTLSKENNGEDPIFEHLDKPGGFRRFHVDQQHALAQQDLNSAVSENPAFQELFRPDSICSTESLQEYTTGLFKPSSSQAPPPRTRHFLEHLAITSAINQFAGENLSDSETESSEPSETTQLLPRNKRLKPKKAAPKVNVTKTVFLLFKAFIGSGILFLPKAFSNGGLIFSIISMWAMGGVSLYCFLLLLECKNHYTGSYGDIGGSLFGPWMRRTVLFSIAISQMGFMCGGTVFIVQNVIEAVQSLSGNTINLDPRALFLLLIVLIMPLVLIRNIAKLSPTALLSDALIVFGLLVLLAYDFFKILAPLKSAPHSGPNMEWTFNSVSYSVFIGTAVYSFEGIGLVIPIRDSMEQPEKFPMVLSSVMFCVAFTLCAVGSLGYIAFGDQVHTIALLNLPHGNLPSFIQLGYGVAVLLSNVLTLFPTIRIIEHALFGDLTGKHSLFIKWQKNTLRFAIVIIGTLIAWLGANDLDKFISIIGSVCCCPLSLIFPPLFHLRLPNTNGTSRWIDMILVAFGTSVMLFTFYNTTKQWAEQG
ncbi:transmembrane amino acid transporter protein-domain-containing protein [Sporodiniella umbellata]|nr:transmembrane amino acid transporter protein-domain-containing protein [Sporodiniella umbellata]